MEKDNRYKRDRSGRVLAGLMLLGVGIVLVMNRLGGFYFPAWMFTWPMLLILIGLFVGLRHRFCGSGWLVMMLIGSLFLAPEVYPGLHLGHFMWPAVIIAIGLAMIFTPGKRYWYRGRRWHRYPRNEWERQYWEHRKKKWDIGDEAAPGSDNSDYIESTSVFGNVRKNILSKNFKGGEITAVLGGAEIDLSQADFEHKARLEIVAVLGGVKLIIPPHWKVESKMTAVLGGIEDKRPQSDNLGESDKTLIIEGETVLGGIEITSF